MEIQKAEEFWSALHERVKKPLPSGATWTEQIDEAESIALIRARDKAIIERCFEAIKCAEGDYAIIRCNKVSRQEYLDSILRDLD
jgi:hypothetical protein